MELHKTMASQLSQAPSPSPGHTPTHSPSHNHVSTAASPAAPDASTEVTLNHLEKVTGKSQERAKGHNGDVSGWGMEGKKRLMMSLYREERDGNIILL